MTVGLITNNDGNIREDLKKQTFLKKAYWEAKHMSKMGKKKKSRRKKK